MNYCILKMMKISQLLEFRLHNQHLLKPDFADPAETVAWFGAMQAQDYLGSLWAIGQRMTAGTEAAVEKAIVERSIVRSWPMRGTLHFTHAKDMHWMLHLLAPRVMRRAASRYRQLALTDEDFKKSETIVTKALIGGKEMTRPQLLTLLDEHGISPSGQRGIHILGRLAMDGLLCFGSRSGKQFTFTLLDEWIPKPKPKSPEEAIAELTKRYFTSHGPATMKDFAWWSGLTMKEVKAGLDAVGNALTKETLDGETYWLGKEQRKTSAAINQGWLLPSYDEYTVAYKDRRAIISSPYFIQAGNGLRPTIMVNGEIIGSWQRELRKHDAVITVHFFNTETKHTSEALQQAAKRYGEFLGRNVQI
jgi:hypothetical protein